MRQFLLHAALKRADELNRLRDLPDTPTRSEVEDTTPKVAGLPSNRSDSDPEEAATINETPVVSIPIEIGEPSSVELPAIAPQVLPQTQPQEEAPVVKKAEQAKPQREARRRVYRARPQTRVAAKPAQSRQYNFFEMLFWGPPGQQTTYGAQAQVSQPYQQPAYGQQYQSAYGSQQQYYQWPVTNSGQTTQHYTGPRSTPY